MPLISVESVRYRQDTRTGQWAVTPTGIPDATVVDRDLERAKAAFDEEYAVRIDLIVALGQSKSDVADIVELAQSEIPGFQGLSRKQKAAVLSSAVRERFHYPINCVPGWLIRDVQEFTERRIAQRAYGTDAWSAEMP